MADAQERPHDLAIDALTDGQAYALAELCKRIGWYDVRTLAVDDQGARLMIQAVERVRGALEQIGVAVR